jgi:hypothetical protein
MTAVIIFDTGTKKSIIDDIQKLEIDEQVKRRAVEICHSLEGSNGTRDSNIRTAKKFFCVYNAYVELGVKKDTSDIAEIVKLPKADVSRALTQFAWPRTSYRPIPVEIKAEDLIIGYAKKVGLRDDAYPSLIALCKKIMSKKNKYPELKKLPPQSQASGLLAYYMTTSGITFSMKSFSKAVHLSEVSLSTSYRLCSRIDNTEE